LKLASAPHRFVNPFEAVTENVPAPQPVLPDLIVHEPSFVSSLRNAKVAMTDGHAELRYAFAIGNRGPGHLVLIGKRTDTETFSIPARQLAYVGQTPVVVREGGDFYTAADGHAHWHYRDTARLTVTKDGLDGWEHEAMKSHFAMLDSGTVEDPAPRDFGIPGTARGNFVFEGERYHFGRSAHTALRVAQTITASKFDLYGPHLNPPLRLPDGAVDGAYKVTVEVDPNDVIAETDETNNTVSYRLVVEGGRVVEVTKVS
jgi:hypothetical protein